MVNVFERFRKFKRYETDCKKFRLIRQKIFKWWIKKNIRLIEIRNLSLKK